MRAIDEKILKVDEGIKKCNEKLKTLKAQKNFLLKEKRREDDAAIAEKNSKIASLVESYAGNLEDKDFLHRLQSLLQKDEENPSREIDFSQGTEADLGQN